MAIGDYIKYALEKGIEKAFSEGKNSFRRIIDIRMMALKRAIMKQVMSIIILGLSVIFLAVSATYFLIDYVALNRVVSFLIMGIILLMAGIIVRASR